MCLKTYLRVHYLSSQLHPTVLMQFFLVSEKKRHREGRGGVVCMRATYLNVNFEKFVVRETLSTFTSNLLFLAYMLFLWQVRCLPTLGWFYVTEMRSTQM